ncbi:hypothetical protein GCM10009858_32520 [Terrabacter carboxydivorans]|uniref:Uncharacterized protein n=1 Tax=Terrabacter carboxydivorans TaxID=619730 RepID=A0ABP5Z615_9MICO
MPLDEGPCLLDPTGREDPRAGPAQPVTEVAAEQVGDRVSRDGGHGDADEREPQGQLERAGGDEEAGADHERVARQEEAGQQAGLREGDAHEQQERERAERRELGEQQAVHGGLETVGR